MERPTNRLLQATSPYLLQHAYDPVDWYPWSEAALARSRQEDKPIFLSVGYSSCHWCHVMEHESFADTETATLMNALFINIKVDREERPDIDDIYMQAVQLFTGGHGGWPMSVFLTPQLEPFFAGTYFPPGPRHGMPGFKTVLQLVADAYKERRGDVARTAQQVVSALQASRPPAEAETPDGDILRGAFAILERLYDPAHGGFGGAPKFPHSMDVSFLLRYGRRSGDSNATSMALETLRRMAAGGIHDQLGGGFHRYATDARWLVPHFEKMLYDNALLARAYLEAFQVSGEPFFRDVCTRILDWVSREMTGPDGGFYSALDADSEGAEGKYYVWTPAEIEAACGPETARVLCTYFGVSGSGNFEAHTNILWVPRAASFVAAELGITEAALENVVEAGRRELLAARARRVRPGLDDKVVAAWNGLMIRAYAQAHAVLRLPEYRARAEAAAELILRHGPQGPFRTLRQGRTSGPGFLDDWACMIAAFLDLYEASFAPRWLELAQEWSARLDAEFDDGAGGWRYTGSQHEKLPAAARNSLDTSTPSGGSVHTGNLLRLGLLTGEERWRERAERNLRAQGMELRQASTAMGEMLCALDLYLGPACEVAVAGRGDEAAALVRAVFAPYIPNKVVAGWPDAGSAPELALLQGRSLVGDKPAVYVCREHVCLAPVTRADQVLQALEKAVLSPARESA